jgi:hypothetical protein
MTCVPTRSTSNADSFAEPVRCRAVWLNWAWISVVSLLVSIGGCHLAGKKDLGLPGRHSLRADQLVVLSDFKLAESHPLIQDLVKLRSQVSRVLKLPLKTEDVTVYLFSDELAYHQYLQTAHPGLPSRRAYFIATEAELAVYTYWGDRIQEDLRHEYTHGLLHAGLKTVPLWLDEGLAEYFEVAGPRPGNIQPDYVHRLNLAVQNGWRPDLTRLEALDKIELMHRAEYRESWGWVHFMLHSSPETRQVLLEYVSELQNDRNPEPISTRLAREIPVCEARMLSYLAGLNTYSPVAGQ